MAWRSSSRMRARTAGLALLGAIVAIAASVVPVVAGSYEGFGAATPAGGSGTVVHVTTLRDAGAGSLREAVKHGSRTVVFDVAGEIVLTEPIIVGGAFVTIDGFSAPSPGITLRNAGLAIRGTRGAHDVVVRGLRVRSASIDGIQVWGGAYNVVIDHVSVDGSGDGNIDITEGSHDVTVSWSILSGTGKNMLIKYGASRVTLHHSIFIGNPSRNPQARVDDDGGVATDLTLDMRHNLVWGWTGYGTLIWEGAWANVASNYYGSSRKAIQVDSARAWVQGNVTADGSDINHVGTESSAFDAPAIGSATACAAARVAIASAGVRPLDDIDADWLARIDLRACPDAVAALRATPGELSFTISTAKASSGAPPATRTVRIVDDAGTGATWTARTEGGRWLLVTPISGSAPGTVTVSASAAGLAPGQYDGSLIVESPGASAITIPVELTVTGTTPPDPSSTGTGGGPTSSGVQQLELQIATGADDGREDDKGGVLLTSQLFLPGAGNLLAFRFTGVPIPRGATIVSATLWFHTLLEGNRPISVRYTGEAASSSAPLERTRHSLSSRPRTRAFVDDVPDAWVAGDANPSPDLAPIVQEIVEQAGWASGHSLTLFIADNGSRSRRRIAAFENQMAPGRAAVLTIEWTP